MTQCAVLTAMIGYSDTAGETRGSSLCYDPSGKLRDGFSEPFRFVPESRGETRKSIQEVCLSDGAFSCRTRDVRPIPEDDSFFENVWRIYRENGGIY